MTWFRFDQNNSFGRLVVNERVCCRVFVEARDKATAINFATENLGIYFDGVDQGFDCPCCGDRWAEPNIIRLKEGDTIETYSQELANQWGGSTTPEIRAYFADGSVKEFARLD